MFDQKYAHLCIIQVFLVLPQLFQIVAELPRCRILSRIYNYTIFEEENITHLFIIIFNYYFIYIYICIKCICILLFHVRKLTLKVSLMNNVNLCIWNKKNTY